MSNGLLGHLLRRRMRWSLHFQDLSLGLVVLLGWSRRRSCWCVLRHWCSLRWRYCVELLLRRVCLLGLCAVVRVIWLTVIRLQLLDGNVVWGKLVEANADAGSDSMCFISWLSLSLLSC